jgi:GNAT superfamily N-acetyltransferase
MGTTSEEPVGTQLLVGAADTELKAVLSAGLEAYNTAAIDAGEQSELSVKVVAEDGSVVAGLAGWTWGTCAGISLVWVREDARRQGWGGQLLAAAERVARQRGCQQIIVTSFTFQAPRFYELHGYVETGRVEGLPVAGEADVHLRKQLQPDDGVSAVP